jgi:exodeoxyribonuclease VII large subunit
MRLDAAPSNAPEWTVSALAGALKRTLEDSFGYVRLKGEISGFRGQHNSGHAYFSLKDRDACIDACIWKGAYAKLRFKPQEGLEVIATGKITTFPKSSKYQIVVESLQPAGVGALMALLEERRRKLAAEGLFDPARRRRPPYLPGVIGVVTSPTGAVIRDILHRLADRFPRHVLVWPVRVQGESCADEVAAAIRGFNALLPSGAIPRPDVIIVARGGGSIEDLWGFNEEIVVRAAAESAVPLISAVGHETDVTLIDHAADVRAPTPTAAAEKAVPVRAELLAGLADLAYRHAQAMLRDLERRRQDLRAIARLPTPEMLFAVQRQRLDLAAAKLEPTFDRNRRDCEARLARTAHALTRHAPTVRLAAARARIAAVDGRPRQALARLTQVKGERLSQLGQRLHAARDAFVRAERLRLAQRHDRSGAAGQRLAVALHGQLERKQARLSALSQLFESLNYKSVLARGYAIVRDADGEPVSSAAAVQPAQALAIEFADGVVRTTADGPRPKRRSPLGLAQASLFDARG